MKVADPSEMPKGPRRFVAFWLRDIMLGFDKRGFQALIPMRFLLAAATGSWVGVGFKEGAIDDEEVMTAFYGALLAVNAILIAVCWSAFGRIYEIMSDKDFGAWLRLRRVDQYYNFYLDAIHLFQMLALASALLGLVLAMMLGIPSWAQRTAIGTVITLSIYAAIWAAGCVRIMQDFASARSTFADHKDKVTEMPRPESRSPPP